MRQDETTAISEALKILTDDDAQELMSKTTGFLQSSMKLCAAGRVSGARALRNAALRLGKPKLAMFAEAMIGDAFAKSMRTSMRGFLKIQCTHCRLAWKASR